MTKKIKTNVGRNKEIKDILSSFLPETPIKKFKSPAEKKVIELLEAKHPVPPTKWLQLKPKERSILREIIRNKEQPYRTKAITALVLSNDKDHVNMLGNILSKKGEDELIRSVIVISLGMSRDPRVGAKLLRFIGDKNEFVRAKVVEALGKVGRKDEFPMVIKAKRDKSLLVRSNAKNAINLMNFRLDDLKQEYQKRIK